MAQAPLFNDFLFLVTAILWGGGFVAQKIAMDIAVLPFAFNGIRFLLGAFSLLPLLYISDVMTPQLKEGMRGGVIAGGLLFLGATLQQIGIIYTDAGRAGFITGFYLVLVPLFAIFKGIKIGKLRIVAVGITLAGFFVMESQGLLGGTVAMETYLLTTLFGDILVFGSAFGWAAHLMVLHYYTKKASPLVLAFIQCLICGVLSLVSAFLFEEISIPVLQSMSLPVFYGGFVVVGIAYTLQVVAQKRADPTHAAIILNLEGLFAAVLALCFLPGEELGWSGWGGGLLMVTGVFLSQREASKK